MERLYDASVREAVKKKKKLDFGDYFILGQLGTALLPTGATSYLPRVLFFFFKQKTAYELVRCLEFRRVLFRSEAYRRDHAPVRLVLQNDAFEVPRQLL